LSFARRNTNCITPNLSTKTLLALTNADPEFWASKSILYRKNKVANANSIAGFYNFSEAITVSTQLACIIPAGGSPGTSYPGYPSPVLVQGAALAASCPPDIAGGELDGHPFRVRLTGTATTAGSYTFSTRVYQVPNSVMGVIGSAGMVTSAGAAGSGVNAIAAASTATSIATATANFMLSFLMIWDASSKHLNGMIEQMVLDGTILAAPAQNNATTQVTGVGLSDLNFMPTFTFGTAGANSVLVREFVIERV
jgi:hypothetical protein